mmetsp:Transcript_48798/g.156054  ORF Transcript_48798/g.156054 Transcript_48798/m.156054 type:complete len:215 (+) Transcript_48798:445-1089(+)
MKASAQTASVPRHRGPPSISPRRHASHCCAGRGTPRRALRPYRPGAWRTLSGPRPRAPPDRRPAGTCRPTSREPRCRRRAARPRSQDPGGLRRQALRLLCWRPRRAWRLLRPRRTQPQRRPRSQPARQLSQWPPPARPQRQQRRCTRQREQSTCPRRLQPPEQLCARPWRALPGVPPAGATPAGSPRVACSRPTTRGGRHKRRQQHQLGPPWNN